MLNHKLYITMYGITSILIAMACLVNLYSITKSKESHSFIKNTLYLSTFLLLIATVLNIWLIFLSNHKIYIFVSFISVISLIISGVLTVTSFVSIKSSRNLLAVSTILHLIALIMLGSLLFLNLDLDIFRHTKDIDAQMYPEQRPYDSEDSSNPPSDISPPFRLERPNPESGYSSRFTSLDDTLSQLSEFE
jgi:lysylphosphatidylglycerol synthetase-like protein (DUF2156 family)